MYLCQICGNKLNEIPWENELPSDEICTCCGTHFGYDDFCNGQISKRKLKYIELRLKWIKNNFPWFSKTNNPPIKWNPVFQLQQLYLFQNQSLQFEIINGKKSQPDGLLSVLVDSTASISERDDAAMDLYKYDEDIVEDSLIKIILGVNIDQIIVDSAVESLSKIWKRKNIYAKTFIESLPENYANYFLTIYDDGKYNGKY